MTDATMHRVTAAVTLTGQLHPAHMETFHAIYGGVSVGRFEFFFDVETTEHIFTRRWDCSAETLVGDVADFVSSVMKLVPFTAGLVISKVEVHSREPGFEGEENTITPTSLPGLLEESVLMALPGALASGLQHTRAFAVIMTATN